ncbi:MaoC/PaaZ C-terminal domain-containing protein [Treponema endosymbiont of Eucomonympha sp.]|uniref:MaoC/PaaZ C-terminal domain-containing protein n=1 Tax=Treponema endosymbiont of Eucomonympha sp. TaxID=1580831 RepID=UPI0007509A2C|nr:MaoC/PaaZ C-terminal domain-containing protein [Treponema endosymbiont of Eucomonympha sp.]
MEFKFEIDATFEKQFTVSNDVYDGFIRLFQDRNPLHTNQAFAVGKGFRSVVMHGNILNGFLSYFIGEALPVKNVMIYSQEINYKRLVYLNDRLTLKAIVDEVHESVNVVMFKFSFVNQSDEIVAKGTI